MLTCSFKDKIDNYDIDLVRNKISILQVNIGKRCNQACHHCHVESGPNRTENMEIETIDRILELLNTNSSIHTVDITGGAPELNPNFRYFVSQLNKMNIKIIDRCNLTILLEPKQEDTADFLAENKVEVIASLPCYLEDNVNKQRGKNVFNKSIKAINILNKLGYGKEGSELTLNLVYNPVGEYLPPEQSSLEHDYKIHLKENFDIEFNSLFTITNMPIKRYAHSLNKNNKLDEYMQLLSDNFNPEAANKVMCKELISIGWDGYIYDCDFNQMLDIPINWIQKNIFDIKNFDDLDNNIAIDDHCFGCTAGAGSSCRGALS